MFNTFNKLLLFQRMRTNSTTILPPQLRATYVLPIGTGSGYQAHLVFSCRQPTIKISLTAILSADVAGYSRLMQDDEAATVKTLEAYK